MHTQSCLVLCSFGATLLHSLIMWSMVSSLSPRILHLVFCCDLSIIIIIIIIIIILLIWKIFCICISWGLSDSKSFQVFRTLLSILADLRKAVVWIISTRPLISKSSSSCTSPFVTSVLIIIGINVTSILHSVSVLLHGPGTHPSFHFYSILYCG